MSTLQPVNAPDHDCEPFEAGPRRSAAGISAAIDRHPLRAFLLLSAFYFVAVLSLSSLKLLWLDELITLHIAQLGSPSAIWHALEQGVDPNPPVTHLLVHYSRLAFGDHEWAYRLPAMIGYWTGLLALFAYLLDHLPSIWALAGTVLAMTMGAFEYSYESRSYGIFYGLAMLAFLCWCRTVDPTRTTKVRRIALAGMVLALAAGISTNYFAVLAFAPICLGEIARTIATAFNLRREIQHSEKSLSRILARSIDYRIWLALLISGVPLAAYRNMIAHSIAQFAPYAWNKVSLQQVSDSYTEMVEAVLYPLLGLFVLGGLTWALRRRVSGVCASCRTKIMPRWIELMLDGPSRKRSMPVHELVGIAAFMAYPLLGYVIATIRGGMLSPRFVIPVCFGFAIAGALISFRLFGSYSRAGAVTICFLACWFICREAYVGYWYEEQKQCFYKVVNHLSEAEAMLPDGLPIVIPDPLLVLTFRHYAPPEFASRAVFPVDFPAIRFYRHDDSPEENLWAGRKILYSVRIIPLADFETTADNYLIIAGDGNWFLDDLRFHHYEPARLSINTRAGAMGGFTPLAHGTPAFYLAGTWSAQNESPCRPQRTLPFRRAEELPNSEPFDPNEDRQ
jgi:hypothetical protein